MKAHDDANRKAAEDFTEVMVDADQRRRKADELGSEVVPTGDDLINRMRDRSS
jgi:replication fork clamp-binding protein CrfC